MTQLTKQTIDAIMADERFHSATKDMPPGLLIAMMITLAVYRKELPGDAAVAAPAAEGQQPPESGQGPAADTQSANEHKPDSAESFSTLFRSVLPGLNVGNRSVAESVLAQFLNAADESQPESESGFESECPMVAQVASLTEQVNTLQDDVKMLVDLNRELYDGLRVLGELVIGRAVAKSN